MMPWWVASIMANVAIIWIEYMNRGAANGWLSVLPKTALPILIAQWGLFQAWNGAPHWMTAWLVFYLGSSALRIGSVAATTQEIGSWPHIILGIALLAGGSIAVKLGLQ